MNKKGFGSIIFIGIVFVGGMVFLYYTKQKMQHENSNIDNLVSMPQEVRGVPFLTQDSPINLIKTISLNTLLNQTAFDEPLFAVHEDIPIRTTQWFSSLYFVPGSESMFVYPLAIKFAEKSMHISYPQINVNENVVFGSAGKDIEIIFSENVQASVVSTGDFSVTVAIMSTASRREIAEVVITRGSPYIFMTLKKDANAHIVTHGTTLEQSLTEGASSYKAVGSQVEYGIYGFEGVHMKIDVEEKDKLSLIATKDARITIGLRTDGLSWQQLEQFAGNFITTTEASFVQDEDQYFNAFIITTQNGEDTLWGALPHQAKNLVDAQCLKGVFFATLRGAQSVCQGTQFYVQSNRSVPQLSLDVGTLTESERTQLAVYVKQDIEKFDGFEATDTYFLGKELLRAAHLYDFAKQLNLDEGEKIKSALYQEFDAWRANIEQRKTPVNGKYITYDNIIHGVVGHKTSFGSEEFNDHHFHYGYFIHTAAILGHYDRDFLTKNESLINLYVKDYVNIDRQDNNFAFIRDYDFYEGHSWAAGTARFGDGNNQESTSEAVHAYYAVYVWASLLGNVDALRDVSLWLYNQESESARFYWFLADKNSPRFDGYKPSAVSLLWGGKIEWGTWFSGEPEAKLGIQIIPVTAGSDYLGANTDEQIETHLQETAFPEHKLFYDQLLMYKVFSDPAEALRLFQDIEDKDLDGGNSRSFLYAWIAMHQNK